MANTNGNAEFKSDVFSLLLADKKRALEVYNAMNDTSYDNPELIENVALEDKGISLSIRNDASFIIDYHLSLYEHQSTYSPNMPLRELIYFVNIISRRLKDKNLYGRSLVKIPVPYFVVFYNGKEPAPEHYELRLSDAFERHTDAPEIELICQVYNINKGNNEELLSKCPTLRDYMYFVDLVREYHAKNNFTDLKDAIRQAIDQCISEDILRDFLKEHRQEVEKMMQLDYTFERQIELERQEARKSGEEIGWKLGEEAGRKLGEEVGRKLGAEAGRKLGVEETLREQIRKKILKSKTLDQIAEDLEETPDKIRPLYEQITEELAVTQNKETE